MFFFLFCEKGEGVSMKIQKYSSSNLTKEEEEEENMFFFLFC